jgi:hypothetical protein
MLQGVVRDVSRFERCGDQSTGEVAAQLAE